MENLTQIDSNNEATTNNSVVTEEQKTNQEYLANPNIRTVELDIGVKRGGSFIKSFQLNKPNVGTLRNLSLQDVLKWQVEATNILLSRITYPTLTIQEIETMDVSDYTTLAVELTSFLVSAKAKSQLL